MIRILIGMMLVAALTPCIGCKRDAPAKDSTAHAGDEAHGDHAHGDGDDHGHGAEDADAHDDHGTKDHDEMDLESAEIGGMTVKFAQGHGLVKPGLEGHLVVKLPYNDNGATVVRAWIGTEDRTVSFVGKGTYAESHDDYDVHAIAPDPLPGDVMWWVEITKPDSTPVVGSVKPLVN